MNRHTDPKTLWKLFITTLYISAFTFGGGFVIITFMKRKFVDELHWLEEDEMLDLAALAQASPGANAVNTAILVGWRVAGAGGMLIAVVGTLIPPVVLLTALSYVYGAFIANPYVAVVLNGMRAGVAAVILDVVCDLGGAVLKQHKPVHLVILAGAFLATLQGVNVVIIILVCALVGILLEVWHHGRKGGAAA